MKNFKIALCALLVLCSGLVFAACGKEEVKTFDANTIELTNRSATYDGNSHIFTVNYPGVKNLTVTYSLSKEGVFASAANLGLVEADEYDVYYKLSAKGYADYVSSTPVEFTIEKRQYDFEFAQQEYVYNISKTFNPSFAYRKGAVDADKENVKPVFSIYLDGATKQEFPIDAGQEFDAQRQAFVGKTLTVELVGIEGDAAKNYQLPTTHPKANLKVVNNIAVSTGEEGQFNWFSTLQEAVDATTTTDGATLVLHANINVDKTVYLNKTLTIASETGTNRVISISKDFDARYNSNANGNEDNRDVLRSNGANKTLTLKNVTVDGANTVTCVRVDAGTLKLEEGAKIVNGRKSTVGLEVDIYGSGAVDDFEKVTGGVFVTGDSTFVMNGGQILNNKNEPTLQQGTVRDYAADLWLGSRVKATIAAGQVGNVWVNSNSSALKEEGVGLTVSGTAQIENVYVEYDVNSAKLAVETGAVVKKVVVNLGEELKTFENALGVETGNYIGGLGLEAVKIGEASFASLEDAFKNAQTGNVITLLKDATISKTLLLDKAIELTIKSNSDAPCTITVGEDFEGFEILRATNAGVQLTLEDIIFDGAQKVGCIYFKDGTLNINGGAVITHGRTRVENPEEATNSEKLNGGVYLTGTATLNMINGKIVDNQNFVSDSGAMFGNGNKYENAKDLWVGSQAKAEITGGEIGSVWVNANKFFGEGLCKVTGGKITTAYVDYFVDDDDAGYGAKLLLNFDPEELNISGTNGEIETIIVAGYYKKGEEETRRYFTFNPTQGNVFVGGIVAKVDLILADPEAETNMPSTLYVVNEQFESAFGKPSINEDTEFDYEITLYRDVEISNAIMPKTNIKLKSEQGQTYSITAAEQFNGTTEGVYGNNENKSLFVVGLEDNIKFEIENVVLNGANVARGLSAYAGNVTLTNVTIGNGKCNDKSWSGGLFITSSAELTLVNCTVTGNVQYEQEDQNKDKSTKYAADVWVGANATLTIQDGTIGNLFANANSYSATNPGATTLNSGTVENVWVEFDQFGAKFNFVGGSVQHLYLGLGDQDFVEVQNVETGNYVGGPNVSYLKNEKVVYSTLAQAISDNATEITLLADVSVQSAIVVNHSITINGLKTAQEEEKPATYFTINAKENFAGTTLGGKTLVTIFYLNNENATLTINGLNINGNGNARGISAFAGNVNLTNVSISNCAKTGEDKYRAGGIYLTGNSSLEATNCSIKDCSTTDGNVMNDGLNYSSGMWVGANAKAVLNGGSYYNVFANANKYSKNNAQDHVNLTIKGGSSLENLWVEWDVDDDMSGYGATVKLEKGQIFSLYVAKTKTDIESGEDSETTSWQEFSVQVEDEANARTFVGGQKIGQEVD